ncbi:MAG: ATP-binding protein [Acidobacteria bacterium]|nr:ATP-binding protein [Acidobacteriota bacterium]
MPSKWLGGRDEAGDLHSWTAGLHPLAAVFVLAGLLTWTTGLQALDPQRSITQYVHDMWEKEDGLPMNSVGPVVQTRDGYIWVGTQEGIVRFDGVGFTQFRKGNTTAIRNNHVTALLSGSDGGLWIATAGGGVTRMKDGRFAAYSTEDGLSSNIVLSILEDRHGTVWFGTAGGGLSCFEGGRFSSGPSAEPLRHGAVSAICEDRDGALWAGTVSGGLFRLKDGICEGYHSRIGLPEGAIWSICVDHEGALWIGVHGVGLCRYEAGRLTTYTTKSGLSSAIVQAIYEDRDHVLWIGTSGGGLNRMLGETFSAYTAKDGLGSDYVSSIYQDREGSLWIGASGGGLNRLKDGEFATYGTREGLSSDVVSSVYEDREGNLWIGTFGGGLNRLKEGRITTYSVRDGLPNTGPFSLWEDLSGALWIGSNGGGLTKLKDGRCRTYTIRDGLPNDTIRCIRGDRKGALWIGTSGGGLSVLKDDTFTNYDGKDGLPADIVTCLQEGRDGRMWVGTAGGGLACWHEGRFTTYRIPSDVVTSLHLDMDDVLWIGTNGGGLGRLKNGKLTCYASEDGLFNDLVGQILEDARQNLWMASNTGVFRVSKKQLDDFAEKRVGKISSISYGEGDGLRDSECNMGFKPAGWKTRDGRLWFPTGRGLSVIDPGKVSSNKIRPPLVIEQVLRNNDPSALAPDSRLPPESRNLEFHYAALSFLAPEKVRFRYRLDGFDGNWVEAGTRRAAYYTNIPPGQYTFRVVGCNNDGIWNEEGASFSFSLAPHLYERSSFYLVLSLLPLLIGYGLHRFRLGLITARARLLDERNRVAREIHDSVAQDLSGVVLLLETAKDLTAGQAHPARAQVERATEQTRRCLDEVRRSIWALRPVILEGKDISRALLLLARQVSAGSPVNIRCEIHGVPRPLPEDAEINLLRATQEAVSNAVKHARASDVLVDLSYSFRQTTLRVEDNGTGFDPESSTEGATSGFGLAGMRERIKKLGGQLSIKSRPGAGTAIVITLPARGLRYRFAPLFARLRGVERPQ